MSFINCSILVFLLSCSVVILFIIKFKIVISWNLKVIAVQLYLFDFIEILEVAIIQILKVAINNFTLLSLLLISTIIFIIFTNYATFYNTAYIHWCKHFWLLTSTPPNSHLLALSYFLNHYSFCKILNFIFISCYLTILSYVHFSLYFYIVL